MLSGSKWSRCVMYSEARQSTALIGSDLDVSSQYGLLELQRRIEHLMPRLRLAVIFGGNKLSSDSVIYQSGNSRSWKSYEAVAQDIADSLQRIGFRHVELMPDDMHLGTRVRQAGIHMAWLN